MRVDLALLKVDALVHGLLGCLLDQLLAFHQQGLHFALLFLLDLELALQFLLLLALRLLLLLLLGLVAFLFLLGRLHLLHLLFGSLLGLGLGLLSNLGSFDGFVEFLLFLVLLIKGLLTDFLELDTLLLLVKLLLQDFVLEFRLQLDAHLLLLSQPLRLVNHLPLLGQRIFGASGQILLFLELCLGTVLGLFFATLGLLSLSNGLLLKPVLLFGLFACLLLSQLELLGALLRSLPGLGSLLLSLFVFSLLFFLLNAGLLLSLLILLLLLFSVLALELLTDLGLQLLLLGFLVHPLPRDEVVLLLLDKCISLLLDLL